MLFYLSFISIFAMAVLVCAFRKDFGEPAKRAFRGLLFLSLGISSGMPVIHLALFPDSINGYIANPKLINWVLGGLCYIGGCLIYINRFPEKKWPGKFCIWGSSHQIWHFMVFSGIVFHFFASLDSYYDRVANLNSC
jgi:adiponectin receptor